ncbi:hypothetical protein RhiLY_02286 [Ceratobasidium sp. AG-Ba]|nr:hypothetical protein RhiLY_02286 [Ceratobasidium sp. AG-Ba]
MSLDTTPENKPVDLAPTTHKNLGVKGEVTATAKRPIAGDLSNLVSKMTSMSLKDKVKVAQGSSCASKSKALFDVTKFTRGKSKGNTYDGFPWMRYFLAACPQGNQLAPEIYVWIVNSPNHSVVYRLDQHSGNLEPCVDGIKGFCLHRTKYLPDVLRQKLYMHQDHPNPPVEIILRGYDDALAEYRDWTERMNQVNQALTASALATNHSHSNQPAGPSSRAHNTQAQPSQQMSGWVEASYPSTAASSSQPQTPSLPNTISIEVPHSITTEAELNKHCKKFKAHYDRLGDNTISVICGECRKHQSDKRPSSLATRPIDERMNEREYITRIKPSSRSSSNGHHSHTRIIMHLSSSLFSSLLFGAVEEDLCFDDSLVDEMESMSLNEVPESVGTAKLKELFETKKYTRGKPKGHSSPWIRYFWTLTEQEGDGPFQVYCWIINSEKNSTVYRVNPTSNVLERAADGTRGFKAGCAEMLPDVVNRKLYIVGEALVEVRLGSLKDTIKDCRLLGLD